MPLPTDIQETFFLLLYGDMSLPDFEQWVYTNKNLELAVSEDDYLELITFGYRQTGAKYELPRIVDKHIAHAEYEKWKALRLLYSALKRDEKLPQILIEFYELYYRGYDFFNELGLQYGVLFVWEYEDWQTMFLTELEKILDDLFPELEYEIIKVIGWIEDGEVVFTGIKDEYSRYQYVDNRKPEAKKPPIAIPDSTKDNLYTAYNNTNKKLCTISTRKPWWKFW